MNITNLINLKTKFYNSKSNAGTIDILNNCETKINLKSQNNTGILIYCPTISQENLNRFMRISFVIQKIGTKEQKDFSLRIWNALKQNSQIVKNVWTSFKPQDIAENLVLLPNEIYDSRGENFFREIRILFTPKSVFIAPMIDYWCKIFNKPNPKQWEQLLPNIMV